MLATDLADYLVDKGMPFREAYGVVKELCRHCDTQGLELQDLTLEEYHRFSDSFDQDVYSITAESSAAARDNPGGTAPNRVADELGHAKELLESTANDL